MLASLWFRALLCLCLAPSLFAQTLDGYTPQSSAAETAWEAKFRALPSTDNLRSDMQRLSARPHAVGSPYDKDNADWLLGKFREWGFDAHIETFYVLFPTPKERALEMLEPHSFTASMLYETQPFDPTIFAAVAATLLAVAALACLVPAWKASRIDPMQALRFE